MGNIPSHPGSSEAPNYRRDTLSSRTSPQTTEHRPAPGTPSIIPPTSSSPAQQSLPQGWEVRTDRFGRPYFLDHVHRRTTFVDPRVPSGWEMQLDPFGRPYFIDHTNKKTTWQDPRLLPGWEIQLDTQGKPYYIDHVNKITTYTDPRLLVEAQSLPPGWEVRMDPQGKLVYIHHQSKVTTYEKPKPTDEHKDSSREEADSLEKSDQTSPAYSDLEKNDSAPSAQIPPDDDKSCVICLENERCVALIPCGHLCLCKNCCGSQTKCPVCRTPIREFLRTFNV